MKKRTFEECLKAEVEVRYKFRRGSLERAVKEMSEILEEVESSRKFDGIIRSRQGNNIKRLLEKEGFEDDKFEEATKIFKRERRI
ncbi:MAG: hypothetical protein KAT32_03310 [Candidatus Moranbacteria bacterium]|nr:hypothetical protein [Candidatus Moranbacteria bacterium]